MVATTGTLEREKRLRGIWLNRLLVLLLFRLILLLLQLLLQIGNIRSIEGTVSNAAMLESAAIEASSVVVVSFSDDLATADNDTAVTVVERRLGGLLEAKSQIVIGLHFAVS